MDKILGVYCGNKTGQNLNVTEDKVEIIFYSDGETERRGYVLNFTLVSLPSISSGKWDHEEADTEEYTKFISHLKIISNISFPPAKLEHEFSAKLRHE